MTYTVQFKPLALRQLEKLPRDIQKKLAARIEALRDEPFPSGCRKMAVIPDAWRARELATIASFIRFSRKCHWCLCLRLDTGKMCIGDFEGPP